MLTVLILAVFTITAVILVLFAALCAAIRHEDQAARLTPRAPTFTASITRRIAGLRVRRAVPPDDDEPGLYTALQTAPPSRGSHGGR